MYTYHVQWGLFNLWTRKNVLIRGVSSYWGQIVHAQTCYLGIPMCLVYELSLFLGCPVKRVSTAVQITSQKGCGMYEQLLILPGRLGSAH